MKRLLGHPFLLYCTIAGCLGCTSGIGLRSTHPALGPVGPLPQPPLGALRVYTDPLFLWDDTFEYGRHRDFELYTDDGTRLRTVRNHLGPTDETPQTVRLPAGRYLISVPTADHGWVEIAVDVHANDLTRVDASSSVLDR